MAGARQSPQRSSSLRLLLVRLQRCAKVKDVPEFYCHHAGRTTFVRCFVICTPCANGVADMTATEFDLGIVAHDLFDVRR
jgi:hypothetical protein